MNDDLLINPDQIQNRYLVVHIHNQEQVYHLTRQLILDSAGLNPYSIFHHLLLCTPDVFNAKYQIACLIDGGAEAYLYLNLPRKRFRQIISYLIKDKIPEVHPKTIDLAIMVGLPHLVEALRRA